jgi:putative endonuclease
MQNKRFLKSPPRSEPHKDNARPSREALVWQVYIVRCADGTLYTGVARDVARRVAEHNGQTTRGAKYTKGRRPVRLCHQETHPNRSSALQREAVIKNSSKANKEMLITQYC